MNIQIVGILLRPSSPELKGLLFDVMRSFEAYGVEVMVDSISAGQVGIFGQDFEHLCQKCDLIVTVGGDGTLISGVRRSYPCGLPVVGIHAGTFGFLADIEPEQTDRFVEELLADQVRIDTRIMLEATLYSKDEAKTFYSFNDIVLSRPSISKMAKIQAFVEGNLFNNYYGDGLIISTPAGSTAYNLSCGGPVLYPLTRAFAITPISPHSLTQRPMVLPAEFEITLKTLDDNAVMVVDGQESYGFKRDDHVTIRVAKEGAKLIHRLDQNYFDVLKDKLNWGE